MCLQHHAVDAGDGYGRSGLTVFAVHLPGGVVDADLALAVDDGFFQREGTPDVLLAALVEQGLITEDKMVSVLIEQFGIPFIRPTEYEISTDLLEIFERALRHASPQSTPRNLKKA